MTPNDQGATPAPRTALEQAVEALESAHTEANEEVSQPGTVDERYSALKRVRGILAAALASIQVPAQGCIEAGLAALEWMEAYYRDNLGGTEEEWGIEDFEGKIEDLRERAILAAPPSQEGMPEPRAWDASVFKGADGLERLCEAQEFWDEQPYGTRLNFGPGITDYLHRDVLRAAVEFLKNPAPALRRLSVGEGPAPVPHCRKCFHPCEVLHDSFQCHRCALLWAKGHGHEATFEDAADRVHDLKAALHEARALSRLQPPAPCADCGKELHCEECHREYITWFAPNHLWNKVVRDHAPADKPEPFLCPTCFCVKAEARGFESGVWEVSEAESTAKASRLQPPEAGAEA